MIKRVILVFLLIETILSAQVEIKKKDIIYQAIDKLKNDKRVLGDFYFIGKMQCHLFTKIGKPRYIKRSLNMLYDTNTVPFNLLDMRLIKKYFSNKFTSKTLLNERRRLAPNQDLYTNPRFNELLVANYTCDTLNRLTEQNIENYKEYLENYKKTVVINDFRYELALDYLKSKR